VSSCICSAFNNNRQIPGENGPVHYDGGRNFGETLRRPHFKIIYQKVPPHTHTPPLS
jgi:hypothetical protein